MGHSLTDSPVKNNRASTPWDNDVFVFPATVGQQGFWFLDQLDPGNPAYNIAVRFHLRGPLNHGALVRAMNEVIRRHEALRTVVTDVDGQPVQVVAPSLAIPIPIVDLTDVPADDRLPRSEAVTVAEARRRFKLSTGPLIRATLLRLAAEEHVLLITVHHIISDGWSIGVITQELGALYDAFCRGLDSPLADLPLQFGDYAVWQKKWLESTSLNGQLSYWADRLSDLPLLEVAPDRPRPLLQTSNRHIESIVLPTTLTDDLKALSNREGVTFYMLSLAVLKVLLSRVTGQTDIFVGTLVAGRSRVELEPLIGPFINPLVLRTDLTGDPTFIELLGRVRHTVVDALANQDLPFERVVEVVQPKRDPSRHPVFQINFIYQRDFVRPLEASGLTLTALPSRSPGAIYDLNFFMVERADGWRASCEYNTDLYDVATITGLLDRFQALMKSVAMDPARRISLIPMLTAADREGWMPVDGRLNRQPDVGEPEQARQDAPAFVGPRDEIEMQLAALWEKLLRVKSIGVTTDFFDEGGHSLLAARLLTEIQRTFGSRVTIASFLKEPTIQALAERLGKEKRGMLQDQLFPLQSLGSRPPLILQTGQPHIWRPLVQRLGPDQPVHALFFPEFSSLAEPMTVKDVATNLVETLQAAQPHGPYVLAGWCRSGVIVYEMAQQIRASGEEVLLVVLFDTYSPPYLRSFRGWKALPVRLYFLGQKLLYVLGGLRPSRLGVVLKMFANRVLPVPERSNQTLFRNSGDRPRRQYTEHLQPADYQYRMTEDYDPEPYDGRVLLFRSKSFQTGRFRDPELGWGRLVRGGLDVRELPGDHQSMFREPVVHLMSDELAEHLDELQTAAEINQSRSKSSSKAAPSCR